MRERVVVQPLTKAPAQIVFLVSRRDDYNPLAPRAVLAGRALRWKVCTCQTRSLQCKHFTNLAFATELNSHPKPGRSLQLPERPRLSIGREYTAYYPYIYQRAGLRTTGPAIRPFLFGSFLEPPFFVHSNNSAYLS